MEPSASDADCRDPAAESFCGVPVAVPETGASTPGCIREELCGDTGRSTVRSGCVEADVVEDVCVGTGGCSAVADSTGDSGRCPEPLTVGTDGDVCGCVSVGAGICEVVCVGNGGCCAVGDCAGAWVVGCCAGVGACCVGDASCTCCVSVGAGGCENVCGSGGVGVWICGAAGACGITGFGTLTEGDEVSAVRDVCVVSPEDGSP
ncbi:hypothetical protein ACWD4J_43935, partial [Streptomyces sp. NPDC002577]